MKTKVKDIMVRISTYLQRKQTVREAVSLMGQLKVRGLPVFNESGDFVGVFYCEALFSKGVFLLTGDEPVLDFCSSNIPTLKEEDLIENLWRIKGEIFPVFNNEGQYVGIVDKRDLIEAFCKDIEYRLNTLEAVFKSAHNGILAIDENGLITLMNPAAEKMARCDQSRAVGRFLNDVVIPTGLLDVVRTGEPQFGAKYQVGKRTYISNRTPIIQEGKIKGAVGVFQEISEIEKISRELKSVKELYQELEAVIQSSYDGIIIADPNGIVKSANRAFFRITGYQPEQVVGRHLNLLLGNDQEIPPFSFSGDNQSSINMIKVSRNGKSLLCTVAPVINEQGETMRLVVNVRDIGELERLREELEYTKELFKLYEDELAELRSYVVQEEGIVAKSPQMKNVLDLALRVAQVDSTVLLMGESGVGKEIIAKVIHRHSQRKNGPYIKVNCSAIPEQLLESELFGYESGAFTGAKKEGKAGLFEIANNGTLLLDEIGDMPLDMQAKLLRVIQEKELVRLGGTRVRKVDVRIIAATHDNLEEKVKKGLFREDLFYRLNVVPITIPPLRERREDILPLIFHFKKLFEEKYGIQKSFSPEVIKSLINYSWPGNVRELENLIERLLVITPGNLITLNHLCLNKKQENVMDKPILVRGLLPLRKAVEEVERTLIIRAIDQYKTTYKVAEVLKVDQSTIVRKLKRYNLSNKTNQS